MADASGEYIELTDLPSTAERLDGALAWALIEASPDGVVVVDGAGVVVLVNHQLERMFGYERAQLVGHPVETLLPVAQRDAHAGHRMRYVSSPHVRPMGQAMELWGRRADGAEFPVEVSLSPCQSAQGQLVIATVRDMTARRDAEQHMRNVNLLLDGISEAVYFLDPDQLTFTYVNQAACAQSGFSRDELLALGPAAIEPGFNPAELADELTPLFAGHVTRRSIMRVLRRRDGSEVTIEADLSYPEPLRGQPRQLVAIVRDVSARIAAETERSAVTELQAMIEAARELRGGAKAVRLPATCAACQQPWDGQAGMINTPEGWRHGACPPR